MHGEIVVESNFCRKTVFNFSQYNVHGRRQSCPFCTVQSFRGLNFEFMDNTHENHEIRPQEFSSIRNIYTCIGTLTRPYMHACCTTIVLLYKEHVSELGQLLAIPIL